MRRLTDGQRARVLDGGMWYCLGVASAGVPWLVADDRFDLAVVVTLIAAGAVWLARR